MEDTLQKNQLLDERKEHLREKVQVPPPPYLASGRPRPATHQQRTPRAPGRRWNSSGSTLRSRTMCPRRSFVPQPFCPIARTQPSPALDKLHFAAFRVDRAPMCEPTSWRAGV
eukprot:2523363-Prymnesium_polylepis.2